MRHIDFLHLGTLGSISALYLELILTSKITSKKYKNMKNVSPNRLWSGPLFTVGQPKEGSRKSAVSRGLSWWGRCGPAPFCRLCADLRVTCDWSQNTMKMDVGIANKFGTISEFTHTHKFTNNTGWLCVHLEIYIYVINIYKNLYIYDIAQCVCILRQKKWKTYLEAAIVPYG